MAPRVICVMSDLRCEYIWNICLRVLHLDAGVAFNCFMGGTPYATSVHLSKHRILNLSLDYAAYYNLKTLAHSVRIKNVIPQNSFW